MAAINKVTERKMNGSRSEIFATEAARSECFLVFWFVFFPPNCQAAVGKRGRSGRILLRVRSMPVFTRPVCTRVCLHVFVHTQDGGRWGGGRGHRGVLLDEPHCSCAAW